MGHRLSKIYTKTGDDGSTGLGDGTRISKTDLRVKAMGDIDELNAQIGLLRAAITHSQLDTALQSPWQHQLSRIQHHLFDLGGEVCIPDSQLLNSNSINELEHTLDVMNADLPMLKDFILPAGALSCAQAHVARTVCRRAERSLIELQQHRHNIHPNGLIFLNRLSDWLFVAARTLQRQSGGEEVLWQKSQRD